MLAFLRQRSFLLAIVVILVVSIRWPTRMGPIGVFSFVNVLLLVALVTAIHTTLLVLGAALSRLLNFDRSDSIAVVFAGSHKTLMVGAYLTAAVGPLAIVPMVTYHAAQLVVDTLVADWLPPDLAATTGSNSSRYTFS